MIDEDEYQDYDEHEGCAVAASVILTWAAIMTALIVLLCSSCTSTKYVPIESVRTEYKDKIRDVHTTDSIIDTRFVYVKGDTVFGYRDRTKWRDRIIHDTCTIIKSDSIPMPYPVERELSRWEQTKMDFGGMALGVLVGALCIAVVWLTLRQRRR